jgi:hypothetical protein
MGRPPRRVRLQHAAANKVQTIFRGYITKKALEFTVSQVQYLVSSPRPLHITLNFRSPLSMYLFTLLKLSFYAPKLNPYP